jgi:uncharacterized protein YecE (DUF72 family)
LEVNSTFYRYPRPELLLGWYNKTPQNFTFTLKANRIITHLHKFHNTQQYTANLYKLAKLLKEKLLSVLFQLPPMLHKDMVLLETIASQLDSSVMNVLEFRHSSWWDSEVYCFLERRGLVFCSVSASGLPADLIKSGEAVYLRLHGKNGWYKHNYPDSELNAWAKQIKAAHAKKVLCYFNNDYNANAPPRNCLTLKKLLEAPDASVESSMLL